MGLAERPAADDACGAVAEPRLAVEDDQQIVAFANCPFARAIHEPLPGDVRPAGTTDVLRVHDHERHNRSIGRGRTGRMSV